MGGCVADGSFSSPLNARTGHSSLFSSPFPRTLPFFPSPLRGEGDAHASGEGENCGSFRCRWGIDVGIPPRILSVILNLFQDLIILFIRLSLFAKYTRCRNKFGMTKGGKIHEMLKRVQHDNLVCVGRFGVDSA